MIMIVAAVPVPAPKFVKLIAALEGSRFKRLPEETDLHYANRWGRTKFREAIVEIDHSHRQRGESIDHDMTDPD